MERSAPTACAKAAKSGAPTAKGFQIAMPTRKKIGLIGAGNIGGELARLCANEELGDVFLYDIPAKEKFAKGKALDLEQNGAVLGYDSNIRGTGNWADLEGADVLIITAGIRSEERRVGKEGRS